jgi:hypothetical protein
LTYEIADELERVGGEILGGVNKSKTFRVMVAYFAFVYKLKNPVQSHIRIVSSSGQRQQATAFTR